jgi:hypothetical protein
MRRDQILQAAKELINGPRAKDYGDAFLNHERIAIGWDVIAKAAIKKHGRITPAHVTLMMDWVKTSRLVETIDHADSWVDKAGYTGLGGEFALSGKELDLGRITDGDVCPEE